MAMARLYSGAEVTVVRGCIVSIPENEKESNLIICV